MRIGQCCARRQCSFRTAEREERRSGGGREQERRVECGREGRTGSAHTAERHDEGDRGRWRTPRVALVRARAAERQCGGRDGRGGGAARAVLDSTSACSPCCCCSSRCGPVGSLASGCSSCSAHCSCSRPAGCLSVGCPLLLLCGPWAAEATRKEEGRRQAARRAAPRADSRRCCWSCVEEAAVVDSSGGGWCRGEENGALGL